jgi:hypothetical protein
MQLNSAYQQVLNDIAEIGIFCSPFINISEAENLSCVEFDYYRSIFKEKFEKEQENKAEFIKASFEFAKKCTEAICKTVAGVFGGKAGGVDTPGK